jgi:segregation and condensation protein B
MSNPEHEPSELGADAPSSHGYQNALSLLLPEVKQVVEGALVAAGEPLTVERIRSLYDDADRPSPEAVQAALAALQDDYEGRAFELIEVAGGWRIQVRTAVAPWVGRLWQEKPARYSRALLETLALIAYRQPITRGEIEQIRGVAVSTPIIKTLTEREWVRVVGHRDVPGRPALYATTRRFLDYFGLRSLSELPPLAEFKDGHAADAAPVSAETAAEAASLHDAGRGRPHLVLAASNDGPAANHDSGVEGDGHGEPPSASEPMPPEGDDGR